MIDPIKCLEFIQSNARSMAQAKATRVYIEESLRMIVTEYVRPPVPTTAWDWVAYIKGDEEANGPTGRGPTECEALRDLCEQLADLWLEREPA